MAIDAGVGAFALRSLLGQMRQSAGASLGRLAILGFMALSGCQSTNPIAEIAAIVAPKPLPVLGGSLVVAGPAQYCPDPASLREVDGAAVVLMGRCSAISPVPAAVISLAIGATGSGSAMAGEGAELAAFLTSDAGRASLSRSGKAEDVRIRSASASKGLLLILIEDRIEGTYWRGMVPVAGHLVSISAIGEELSPEKGRPLVEATARALRRQNPEK